MFPRLAAVVLVASSFLSGAVAGPVPAPTPAPIPVEQRDVGDFFRSIGETSCPSANNIFH